MTGVTVVAIPDLSGKRFAFALAEDRVGHYPEFRDLLRAGVRPRPDRLGCPGVRSARLGIDLRAGVHRAQRRAIPFGRRDHAVVDALEPIADEVLDTDLWAILNWMIEGVGPPVDAEGSGRDGASLSNTSGSMTTRHSSDVLVIGAVKKKVATL